MYGWLHKLTVLSWMTQPSNKAMYDATMLFSMCLPALCKARKGKCEKK